MARGVEHREVGAARRARARRRRRGAAPAPPPPWPRAAPRPASCPSPAPRARSSAASTTSSRCPGCSRSPARPRRRRRAAGARPGRASGWRTRRPGSRVATVSPPGERVDVGVGQVGAVVDARGAQLDGQRARPGRGRAGCRAPAGPGPAARPASSTARASSPSNACGLRRLAEHVDPAGVRRAGGEHRAGDQGEVVVAGRRPAGTTCAPRNVVSAVTSRGQAQRALLVRDGQPVAALDLDGRRALGAHLGDPGGRAARAARRRRRPGWRRRSRRSRRRRRARRAIRAANSAARSPAKTRWVWESTKPGHHGAAADVDPRGRRPGRGAAGPTQATRPSSATTRRVVRAVPSVGVVRW